MVKEIKKCEYCEYEWETRREVLARLCPKCKRIFEEILNKCELCKKTYFKIEIHHKDGHTDNNSDENLMILCQSCHKEIHNPRKRSGRCRKDRNYYDLEIIENFRELREYWLKNK